MLNTLNTLWYLVVGGIVLCLPGIAWWAWFPEKDRDVLERLAEITGLSIAITALVALVFFLLDRRLSPVGLVGIYGFLGLLAAVGIARRLAVRRRSLDRIQDDQESSQDGWKIRNTVLLVVFAALVAWRIYQVRDLVLPTWVDSLHHVLIVRVILENGGLPQSLAPYIEIPFTYHYAFHALGAAFAFLARLPAPQAVLVFGQIVNAMVAVSIYRLGIALWGDWRRAGVAGLLAGFVFQMPAYYATWGRYTLLTGLVLLPLTMAVSLDIVNRRRSFQRLVKMALLTGGILLAHYFAAVLLAIFLIFLGLQALIGYLRRGGRLLESHWLLLTVAVVSGAFLAGAWIYRMWGLTSGWVSVTAVSLAESLDSTYFPNYTLYLWRMLGPNRNYVLLALALIGLMVALWHSRTRAFGLWTLFLGLLSIPWGIHLNPFRPDHNVIVLFLPASLLVSGFLFAAWERLKVGRFRRVGSVLVGAAILSLLVWGLWETRFIINSTTVIASQADLEAIEWVEANTPPEARFLTNVIHWQYTTYRGEDGGWWIMPLTGRETLLPPVLYVMGERGYVDRINAFAEVVSRLENCSPEFWDLVRDARVTHIYLVEGRGSLQSEGLEGCPGLLLVYDKDGVLIYEVEEIMGGDTL